MSPPLFNRVVIIGVGLIGSSIGMNLVEKGLAREVIGIGRNKKNLEEAIRRKAIHKTVVGAPLAAPLLEELSEDDLVILATPVQGILRYFDLLSGKPLLMDVGSTKASLVREAEKRRLRFVGTHPIAGTEKSGAAAGEKDLFRGRQCILTPSRFTSRQDVQKIRDLWSLLGSEVTVMDPKKHDRIFAVVSHLPHVAAYTLVDVVGRLVSLSVGKNLSLGGLKGTTRIACSPPEMWRDIFLENQKNILRALDLYLRRLTSLREMIAKKDEARLLSFLRKAQKIRLKLADSK